MGQAAEQIDPPVVFDDTVLTSLAVAVCRGALLANDDLDTRHIARQQKVPLTGTVGSLGLCVRHGYLSREEINDLLTEMIAVGYHLPVDSIDQLKLHKSGAPLPESGINCLNVHQDSRSLESRTGRFSRPDQEKLCRAMGAVFILGRRAAS